MYEQNPAYYDAAQSISETYPSGRVVQPAGAKSITLPQNDKIRILTMTVAEENPEVTPAQPLYDTLGNSGPTSVAQR